MEEKNPFREYSQYIGLGIQLALAVIVFYFIGKWIDDRFQTKPWFSILGAVAGSIGGFISFINKVKDLEKKDGKK